MSEADRTRGESVNDNCSCHPPKQEPRAELDLGPIKARLEKANVGPWSQGRHHEDEVFWSTESDRRRIARCEGYWGYQRALKNADLIANAPTDLAALIAEVERLRRK